MYGLNKKRGPVSSSSRQSSLLCLWESRPLRSAGDPTKLLLPMIRVSLYRQTRRSMSVSRLLILASSEFTVAEILSLLSSAPLLCHCSAYTVKCIWATRSTRAPALARTARTPARCPPTAQNSRPRLLRRCTSPPRQKGFRTPSPHPSCTRLHRRGYFLFCFSPKQQAGVYVRAETAHAPPPSPCCALCNRPRCFLLFLCDATIDPR